MKKKSALFFIVTVLTSFQSCKKDTTTNDKHLIHFGFTLVDVGWDDPFDTIAKTNYIDEVAAFSNVADILVVHPTDTIISQLQLMAQNNMKAMLQLSEIIFYYVGAGGPSGGLYDLRPDYQIRWNTFIATNNILSNSSLIQAFFIDEPTWNSISFLELKSATDYIKSTIPSVPIMVIEAYPIINSLQVPTTVDWVGFDHYFLKDPNNNSVFRNELNIIKSKRSTLSQKIVLIMDAHYISSIHGNIAGITETEMASIATSYYNLAKSEPDVVALLGYFWPGGFDDPSAKGARELPKNAKDEYARIGKLITGK